MLRRPPPNGAPPLVVVGGAETGEFQRQTRMYAEAFATDARPVGLHVVPRVDRFDEPNVLADPSSPFFGKVSALPRG